MGHCWWALVVDTPLSRTHTGCPRSLHAGQALPVALPLAASVLSTRCVGTPTRVPSSSTLDAPIRRSWRRVSCVIFQQFEPLLRRVRWWNRPHCCLYLCYLCLRICHTCVRERQKLLQAQTRCCERGAAPPVLEVSADFRHPLDIEMHLSPELTSTQLRTRPLRKSRTLSRSHVVVNPQAGMRDG